jgi:hypothetical protein
MQDDLHASSFEALLSVPGLYVWGGIAHAVIFWRGLLYIANSTTFQAAERLCAIDGPTFWTAVGSLAIIGATIVALRQLSAFNENERLKTTLMFVDRFAQSGAKTILDEESGASLVVNVQERQFAKYISARDDWEAKHDAQSYGTFATLVGRCIQFQRHFAEVYGLLRRKRLDEALYFDYLGDVIVTGDFATRLVVEHVAQEQQQDFDALLKVLKLLNGLLNLVLNLGTLCSALPSTKVRLRPTPLHQVRVKRRTSSRPTTLPHRRTTRCTPNHRQAAHLQP